MKLCAEMQMLKGAEGGKLATRATGARSLQSSTGRFFTTISQSARFFHASDGLGRREVVGNGCRMREKRTRTPLGILC